MNKFSRIVISSLFLCATSVFADIELVSVSSSGEQVNDVLVSSGSISDDGRFILFSSRANNLVADDTNAEADVFVHDRETRTTERISVSSSGDQANGPSRRTIMSGNGQFVIFESLASNLVTGDTNDEQDIFVYNRTTGVTQRISVSPDGFRISDKSVISSISDDGRFLAFSSSAANIVVNDTNAADDAFVYDREMGTTERISVASAGDQANDRSLTPAISGDGRFVAFHSFATNLVAGDTNGFNDVFVHDRESGITERISLSSSGMQGNGKLLSKALISDNGRFVAFSSLAKNLVEGDTNRTVDGFVHDRETGTTERVSVTTHGVQGKNLSVARSISDDGRFVAFASLSNNLVDGDTNAAEDAFVHDRETGTTERVSLTFTNGQGNAASSNPLISGNGRFVTFFSIADNLVPGDTNNLIDNFVTQNNLSILDYDLSVTLKPTSGTVAVGEYIRFHARFKNNGDQNLANCRALIVNPFVNGRREFSFYTWPLRVANPVLNGAINIAPGETGQMNLAVLPRVPIRQEVRFDYKCDNDRALTVPFINTVHLTAKTEPLIAEDFVQIENSNNRTALEIDRSNGKYWTLYAVNVSNASNETASVNLTTASFFPDTILRQSQLCEPVDPVNGNWSCSSLRDTQIQVELVIGQTKKILVFVHARQPIDKMPAVNQISLEARDAAGDIVAKTSMGISTIN